MAAAVARYRTAVDALEAEARAELEGLLARVAARRGTRTARVSALRGPTPAAAGEATSAWNWNVSCHAKHGHRGHGGRRRFYDDYHSWPVHHLSGTRRYGIPAHVG